MGVGEDAVCCRAARAVAARAADFAPFPLPCDRTWAEQHVVLHNDHVAVPLQQARRGRAPRHAQSGSADCSAAPPLGPPSCLAGPPQPHLPLAPIPTHPPTTHTQHPPAAETRDPAPTCSAAPARHAPPAPAPAPAPGAPFARRRSCGQRAGSGAPASPPAQPRPPHRRPARVKRQQRSVAGGWRGDRGCCVGERQALWPAGRTTHNRATTATAAQPPQ